MRALRADLVTIQRLLAESNLPNAAMPVCLEAASAFIVCSNVISTAVREKDLSVLLMDSAQDLSVSFNPGCISSILQRVPHHPSTWHSSLCCKQKYSVHLSQNIYE